MKEKTDIIASKYLGQKTNGSEKYDNSLLVAIPRDENRVKYEINSDNLIFNGWDIWHAYEFSALTENNLPVTSLLKLKYNCTSKYLVESKSLKLYLNSFNMSNFGKTRQECLSTCKNLIEQDLSNKLKTHVEIEFLSDNTPKTKLFENYKDIMQSVDETKLEIKNFEEAPELLKTETLNTLNEYRLKFGSLRSNCRVTHQPDFGDLFIYYKSYKHITEDSLIKYLTSFRKEYHFHEECVEMIYKRLFSLLNSEDELLVCALYTRRGGIDISPARWSKNFIPKDIDKLIDLKTFARYGVKQ